MTSSALTPDMRELLNAVNVARGQARACGSQSFDAVLPVTWNDRLTLPALAHAQDMSSRGFFSHTGSDGSDIGKRVDRVGYSWTRVGENLAESTPGAYSPSNVVAGWLSSPSHCANIMESAYTEMGAVKLSAKLDYWVQVFARP